MTTTDNTPHTNADLEVAHLPIDKIRPSPTNPRKRFTAEEQKELEDSLRQHGFTLTVMLVRPMANGHFIDPSPATGTFDLCRKNSAGGIEREKTCASQREADAELAKVSGCFEIVAGERRWRAAKAIGLQTAPAFVRVLSDQEVLIQQLVENLQRKDLSPMEEAEGYARVLAQRDADNKPLYTVEQLAKEIGKSPTTVFRLKQLCHLDGEARAAVEKGELPYKTALLIARIPDEKQRHKAAKEVLHPQYETGPLSFTRAEQIVAQKFRRSLDGAPFDQADAELVPVEHDAAGERCAGGACADCPFKTGNAKKLGDDLPKETRNDVCMNPGCFDRKKDAGWKKWQDGVTDPANKRRGATEKESQELYRFGDQLDWNCDYVDLADHPAGDDLKPGAADPGTWRKLTKGAELEVLIVPDRLGREHELVKKELAVAAAVGNGAKCFRARSSQGENDNARGLGAASGSNRDHKLTQARERRDRALADAIRRGTLRAVEEAAGKAAAPPASIWQILIERESDCDNDEIGDILVERAILPTADNGWDEEDLKKLFAQSTPEQLMGVMVRLAIAEDSFDRSRRKDRFAAIAKACGVNPAESAKKAKAEFEAAEKAKAEFAPGLTWLFAPNGESHFDKSDVCDDPAELAVEMPKVAKVELTFCVARSGKKWFGGRILALNYRTKKDECDQSRLVSRKEGGVATIIGALLDEAYAARGFLQGQQDCPAAVIAKLNEHIDTLLQKETEPEPPNPKILAWLTSTPASDGNFKAALADANLATVSAALKAVEGREGAKIVLKALETRLKALEKEQPKSAAKPAGKGTGKSAKKADTGKLTAEGRAKLAAALKARWAARKKGVAK